MVDWHKNPQFEDLEELARRLEASFASVNASILEAARIAPGELVQNFATVQADILRFDDHARKRLALAIEDKRVKTMAQDNIFMACVLSSAVALSEFKRLPRRAGGPFGRQLNFIKTKSTTSIGLFLLAVASFNALLSTKAWQRLKAHAQERKSIIKR